MNKTCPECNSDKFSSRVLWRHTLFGNKIECPNCGTRLKLKIGVFSYLLNVALTTLLFIGSVVAGYYLQSWYAFALVLVLAFLADSIFYQFGKLSKLGFN